MDKKPLIGIVMSLISVTNVSVVLGDVNEIPHGDVVGIGPNLAPNPSFEEGDSMPTGWTYDLDTNGIYHWDSNYSYSGEKSIGVLNLTNEMYPYYLCWITTDFIPVDCEMNSYIFSAWFKFVDIDTYHAAVLHIQAYDINYQYLESYSAVFSTFHLIWQQISRKIDNNDYVKYVKLDIGLWYDSNNDPLDEVRFDDVYFGVWNSDPNTPTITGETYGKVRTLYDYTFKTIDPNLDNVSYEIDWGDNTTTTTHLYESGEEIIISHIWGIEGNYSIRVKAIDEHKAESDWANLTITMPCSYDIPFQQFWIKIFERYPNAFPILQYLLGFNQ